MADRQDPTTWGPALCLKGPVAGVADSTPPDSSRAVRRENKGGISRGGISRVLKGGMRVVRLGGIPGGPECFKSTFFLLKYSLRDLSGAPVVKTPHSQCWVQFLARKLDSHMPQLRPGTVK